MLITHVSVYAIQADAAGFIYYLVLFRLSYWLSSIACTALPAFKRTNQSQVSGKEHLLSSCLFFLDHQDVTGFANIFQAQEHGAEERVELCLDGSMSVSHLIAAHNMLSIVVACHAADKLITY